jgi:hypothetical protein
VTTAELMHLEETARVKASEAFHDHPSNPSSCAVYEKHHKRRCPCEEKWRDYLTPKDKERFPWG